MISFFAKPPFEMKHLQRVSSIIRGEQISAYMGNARLNPESGYENDTCIYVKPHIKPDNYFKFEKKSWLDIQDAWGLIPTLEKYPNVGVITYSDQEDEKLSFLPNKRAKIPHHHVNFEREVRKRDKITRVGVTGSGDAFKQISEEIKEGLRKRNITLDYYSNFYPRMSVARFHGSLDIHMHWRHFLRRRLSAPFKIINAMSFGVPTIALDEPSFKEVEGTYIPVKTPQEWLEKLDMLIANPKLYKHYADAGLKKAEEYHISNIAKLYERLDQ